MTNYNKKKKVEHDVIKNFSRVWKNVSLNTQIICIYCYENENSVISFNIKTINKSNTNTYIKLFISKSTTTSVLEKHIDNGTNRTTSNVNKIHKQQWSYDRVLDKVRTWAFYFKSQDKADDE